MATSINPGQPIPNQPFFYPETWFLQGALGPLVTGNGLCVDAARGIICATGGGGGGGGTVTSIVAGAGLTGGTITTSGTIALATTGIIPGAYPRANVTVDPYGRITAISSSPVPGTVCSITAGTGLTGGVITSTGTVAIASTGVTAGTYTYPTLTVNERGQILNATSCTAISALAVNNGICVAGGGANPITTAATISLTNTGVTAGNYTVPSLTVDAQGRITAISSGNNGVVNIATGTGLTGGPITSTGTISLSNTGVTAGSYCIANITVDAQGRLTSASPGAAVTCISTGTGLSGGPITSTGSIALAPLSPSSSGSYTFANVTVDSFGRVATASSTNLSVAITGTAPVSVTGNATSVAISVADATTSQKGVVSLTDDLVTNCATTALTAAQGYSLQQQITALATASNQTLAGTFDATASVMLTVTSDGTAAGFTVGSDLPAPAVGNTDFFVIVTTGGSYSPPGGGGPYDTSQGDWMLSSGTAWQFLNVGYDEDYATTTTPGTIQLATEAQVLAGTDSTLAVTPLTLRCNYVPNSCYSAKGDVVVGTGAGTYSALPVSATDGAPLVACSTETLGVAYGPLPINQDVLLAKGDMIVAAGASTPDLLPVGANDYVLTADSAETLGVKWAPLPAASIPCSQITGVGALITGSAPNTPTTLASSNTNGDVLVVCTACASGLAWCTPGSFIQTCCITDKGVIITGTAANTPTALPVGADGQVLTACALCPTGLYWAAATVPAIPCACITGKGALIAGSAADTPTALSVGADGQVLTACAACSSGLFWAAASVPAIPCSIFTAKGSLVSASAADTPQEFVVGSDGQLLTANSGCALGLEWVDSTYIPCSLLTEKGDIVTATALGTPAVVNIGLNGQYLRACSACPSGLTWGNVLTLQDTPVGLISWFAATTAPLGWLVADGREISRTAYSSLFAVIGTTYGAGNGSTTFNIPDLRGMFARGWDAAGGSARNCDPGRAFGSTQNGMVGPHTHNLCYAAADNIVGSCPYFAQQTGTGGLKGSNTAGFSATCAVQLSTGTETRPVNVAMLPCIKYEETLAPLNPVSGIPCSCITGKGALLTGGLADSPQALPVGVPGSLLMTNTGCALGIEWAAPGTNGQILMACSACATGMQWQTGAVGPWISAGTVQSVGFTSTGVTPGYGTTSTNNISYRQIGPKEWQVVGTYYMTADGTSGTGDYVFTLPNSLSFDTTLPFQQVFNTAISPLSFFYILPDSKMFAASATAGVYGGFQGGIVPRSATTYRIMASTTSSSSFWGAGFYALGDTRYMKWSFSFTST